MVSSHIAHFCFFPPQIKHHNWVNTGLKLGFFCPSEQRTRHSHTGIVWKGEQPISIKAIHRNLADSSGFERRD